MPATAARRRSASTAGLPQDPLRRGQRRAGRLQRPRVSASRGTRAASDAFLGRGREDVHVRRTPACHARVRWSSMAPQACGRVSVNCWRGARDVLETRRLGGGHDVGRCGLWRVKLGAQGCHRADQRTGRRGQQPRVPHQPKPRLAERGDQVFPPRVEEPRSPPSRIRRRTFRVSFAVARAVASIALAHREHVMLPHQRRH
jgi:hypothetical protein